MEIEKDQFIKAPKELEKVTVANPGYFFGIVRSLEDRENCPNPEINELMAAFRRLIVDDELISITVTDKVSSPSFVWETEGRFEKGIIFLPLNLLPEDQFKAQGDVVMIASLAVDFFNGHDDRERMEQRSLVYQAEFIRTTMQVSPY